jgi:hypothetical protein
MNRKLAEARILAARKMPYMTHQVMLQRFEVFPFSAGPTFSEACQERLAWIRQQEAGPDVPMPLGMEQMG